MRNCDWLGVAPVDLPYLTSDRDRHGNVRWYVRNPPDRRKVRIRGDFGSETFLDEYWQARKAETKPKPIRQVAKRGSFRWIVEYYTSSDDFKALDPRLTQRPRQLILDKIVAEYGDLPAVIPTKKIRNAVNRRTPGAAKDFLSALRAVYRIACRDELIEVDPTAGVKRKRVRTEGFHAWTDAECARFEAKHPVGTKARLAYALGLYTASRVSDVAKLGIQMETAGGRRIRFQQQKNRNTRPVWVDLPIVPALRQAIDAVDRSNLGYLETEYGNSFSADGLSNKFRDWCDQAGLQGCTFHGLRKAAGRRMAEKGATPHEIMAAMGHVTHQQAATYTTSVNRAKLADSAFERTYGEQIVPLVEDGGTETKKKA